MVGVESRIKVTIVTPVALRFAGRFRPPLAAGVFPPRVLVSRDVAGRRCQWKGAVCQGPPTLNTTKLFFDGGATGSFSSAHLHIAFDITP